VLWDADFYNSLPDDDCLYCLTKKQIYLIGQAIIPQLQWNTRWVGDTSGLDIDEIVANVEVAITMPKCDDISEMLWTINQLAISLQNLQNTVENDGVPVPNETIETPFYQYQGIADNVAGITLACGTTDDKDKIYGGVHEFVEFCCEHFTDFLQYVRATGSAVPEKLDGIISAVPLYETLPIDEIFGFAAYIFEEVEEAWDALLTVDRKQEFKCKLFCAIVANDCTFTPELLMNVIALEAPIGFSEAVQSGIRDAVAIVVIGQPIGDEMFYSLIGVMLLTVLAGEEFFGATGFRPFEYRFLSGYNSPDNDWTVFCDECATIYWTLDYRFYQPSEHEFVATLGDFSSVFWLGEETDPDADSNSDNRVSIERTFSGNLPKILGCGIIYDGEHECGITGIAITYYNGVTNLGGHSISPTPSATLGRRTWSFGLLANAVVADKVVIAVSSETCDGTPTYARIHGVRLWLAPDSDLKGTMQYQSPLGIVPNGSTSEDYWIHF
jgi:hypothetical protein